MGVFVETTLDQYSPILRGRSTNKPSLNQLHAITRILNSIGLWSGHWARHSSVTSNQSERGSDAPTTTRWRQNNIECNHSTSITIFAIACDVVYSTSELILSLTASPQEAGYSMPRSTH